MRKSAAARERDGETGHLATAHHAAMGPVAARVVTDPADRAARVARAGMGLVPDRVATVVTARFVGAVIGMSAGTNRAVKPPHHCRTLT